MPAVTSLLGSLIDYAGLFPPAQLGMHDAVRHYGAYLTGAHNAVLGRFVFPLTRLAEFESAYNTLPPEQRRRWNLSVLAGSDAPTDADTIATFNSRHVEANIVSVETKASSLAEITRLGAAFPSTLEVWIELSPHSPNLSMQLDAIRSAGRHAKLRTGGVTPDGFPAPADIARFLRECQRRGIVMKATAGLHHPLRGDYCLTYDAASARATMFGFLNVFLAAALIHANGTDNDAIALLEDGDANDFTASSEALAWRDHRFTVAQIDASRRALGRSFGSCSFTEPIEGLQKLRWI
jgi:hypothetical protein